MLLQTINQSIVQSKNTSESFRMSIYTNPEKEAVQNNQIRNCPITREKISRSESIYGPQIPIIQGKVIRRIPDRHKTIQRISLPPIVAKHRHTVEVSMDFLFFVGVSFLQTKSRKIAFRSFQSCNSRGKPETTSGLKQVKI